MASLLKVEFHCHTIVSKDSLNHIPALLKTARKRGLDRLIITDHNSIQGALQARELDPQLVIVGEEIRTDKGELLAAFVTQEIPRGLPVLQVIQMLREQGAFISVSHPFDRHRGWQLADLMEIIPLVDAIETFNSRCMDAFDNTLAARFAAEHNLAVTVGSDSHFLPELGRAVMHLPCFSSGQELRQIIRQGQSETRLSAWSVHLASRFAVTYKALTGKLPEKTV